MVEVSFTRLPVSMHLPVLGSKSCFHSLKMLHVSFSFEKMENSSMKFPYRFKLEVLPSASDCGVYNTCLSLEPEAEA